MHVIFSQFSGLIGLLVLLNSLWRYTPLENAAVTAFGAALSVYIILLAGDFTIRRILAYNSAAPALAGGMKHHQDASASSPSHNTPVEKSEHYEAEGVPA